MKDRVLIILIVGTLLYIDFLILGIGGEIGLLGGFIMSDLINKK